MSFVGRFCYKVAQMYKQRRKQKDPMCKLAGWI